MKQKYYLALTAEEWRLMIESLNNLRNRLISEGKYTMREDIVMCILLNYFNYSFLSQCPEFGGHIDT